MPSTLAFIERAQIRGGSHRETLNANANAGRIHHVEHLANALMLDPTDDLADAPFVVAELQDTGRRPVDAHLVLDRGHRDVVELAERAVRIDADSRHEKER
jgi:hypothetical protein